MSRKFSDSEIRAYSKNRYEEKVLRYKLEKLKEDMGSFHDTSAKQRQDLVEECKGIRMTTGGSPVPFDIEDDDSFELSRRVQRPWAYSVMEITHNVAYQDAVIPLPKQKRRRPKSEVTSRSLTSRLSSVSQNNKLLSPSLKTLSVASASDSGIHDTNRPLSSSKSTSFLQVNHNQQDGNLLKPQSASSSPRDMSPFSDNPEKSKAVPNIIVDRSQDETKHENLPTIGHDESLLVPSVDVIVPHEQEITNKSNLLSPRVSEEQLMRSICAPVSLPPVYKIDSKSYQDAERSRNMNRSKSRVSFSSNVGVAALQEKARHSAGRERTKPSSPDSSGNSLNKSDRPGSKSGSRNHNETEDHLEQYIEERSNTIVTLDPEAYHDVRIRKLDDVLFKGRRLKNYIHPEDRYKLDPLVMKRRQNKMDRLAKESVSFLKRVNHENIKVEIAFPRSARKRILMKLVHENNSGRGRKVSDDDGIRIQKKIDCFMSSISDYIQQQQYEREQTFA